MRRRRAGLLVATWLAIAIGAVACLVAGLWVQPIAAVGVGLVTMLVAALLVDLVSR